MSTLPFSARKLKEFPILHCFVTYFITEYMSEAAPVYPNVFKEVAEYEVSEFCQCMECGTFYLKAPSEENVFSYFFKINDESLFMKNVGGYIFIPKISINPITQKPDLRDIDFEVVGGDYTIQSYPYAKELLEDKRDTDSEEAWRIVHNFFKDKQKRQMQTVQVDSDELFD